uniref:Uncharacterized protein n=1 Tax=Paulinella chromatophora TaxID=39717 RepID=B1X5P8_PAUCH|nr:hypothetical protein PCC_0857 [Paulinella chromatophora]ACB43267.1 hypothetical protein PCC_0857 [Paulinella chromatophora]
MQLPEFFTLDEDGNWDMEADEIPNRNLLVDYLRAQPPEILDWVARSTSIHIKGTIRRNLQGLMGLIPPDQFSETIEVRREHLAALIASSMMTGYWMRMMEERMELEINTYGNNDMEIDEFGFDGLRI